MQMQHFMDLGFSVVSNVVGDGVRVEFAVYDHECHNMNGEPMFVKWDATGHPDPVDTIFEARPYLHGEVKWDGCSNWHFDEQDIVMLHGCTRGSVERIGKVLAACWDIAAERIGAHFIGDR
jgi:hypothetical protein